MKSPLFRLRWKLLALFAVLSLTTLFFLPTFISSKWIYDPFVASFAKDRLHLEIGQVRLSWFRPMEFQRVIVSDLDPFEASTKPVDSSPRLLTIRSIQTDRGLLGYLLSGKKLGRVDIYEPKIDIRLLEEGSNLERLLSSIKNTKQKDAPPASPNDDAEKKEKRALLFDFDVCIHSASVSVDSIAGDKALVVVPPFDLNAEFRGASGEPVVDILPAEILKEVELTQELVRLGLGKAVPLLAKSAWFDGKVSLETQRVTIPLQHPIDAVGQARLTLHQVRTGPSEPLLIDAIELLARIRDKPAELELVFVDGTKVDVGMQDQRVTHQGLEAGLPKLDERLQFSSSGTVGLVDRSLDLVLLVPVPIEQFARRESVREMGVPRLRVPVGGTLDHPTVKWELMREDSGLILAMMAGHLQDDAPALSNVIQSLGSVAQGDADQAISAAADLVRALRERRKNGTQEANANSSDADARPDPNAEKSPPKRPLFDAIRKAIAPPK